ncbi:MAG: hypothetical protein M3R17_12655 [Bacteroidota bacterium]|nr:hypothetical protein [Bacteroidota bacterium]
MKKLLIFLLAGTAFLHFQSCRKEGLSWNTGVVLPLAHASLSIDNLITDSLSVSNSNGVRLVYSTKFLGLNTDTLFNIPDTTISNFYNLPFGSLTASEGYDLIPPNTSSQTTFAVSSAQLVTGILNNGLMTLHLQNDIRKRVVVRYQIPCATLNGIPFDTSFTIVAAPDATHSTFVDAVINLYGYVIDFTGVNNDRVNTITTSFSAEIDPTDIGFITIYPADTVAAINTFSEIKPFYIRGYFGNQTIEIGPEETGFSLFQRIQSGSIGLDSLTMSLDIDNYIGMDSRLTINNIWSRRSATGQTVYLNHPIIGTPINVNRGVYASTWGDVIPSSYNYTFDNSNSNAKALVENLPDKLGYDVTLVTNPLGNVSGNNDFFFAAHSIDATLNVEMPLNLFADQLTISDTIIPDFSSFENHDDILKGTLTLTAANSFPFGAVVDIYFIDAMSNVTGSVVAPSNVIASGPVALTNGYYVSQGFSNSMLNIPLNETQTQALFHSSKIVFVARFDTNSNPVYAKIFGSNRLDLNLSADFDYRIGN